MPSILPGRPRRSLAAWLLVALASSGPALCSGQSPEDTANAPALEPEAAVASFRTLDGLKWELLLSEPTITQPLMTSFDAAGRLWVAEYRQYPYPAGLKPLSRDKHWRVVYDGVPDPPGRGGLPGLDRISVHEDRDNDGSYETHHVFVDGLNIATAVAPVAGGAWVLNPPYLLYYSDRDGDLRADGNPEIHLTGFGLEDTHSVVNSLCIGPDGWLYAAQGSTVSGAIKAYGTDNKPVQSLGQAIWRYHPVTRQYEIFAEGGGNAFGVAFDDRGEVFSGHNGGDTRGFHYYQGAYYRKGFSKHGSLSNPHSYGYLNPMQHDPIPRFTHTMLWTESTALQNVAPKSMLAVDPLHGKLIQTERNAVGSTYATRDVADTVSSSDKWFRPVAICDGPDGAAYVCDWYDSVVAHIYAFEGKLDRERGRVYRLAPKVADATASPWNRELASNDSLNALEELLERLSHPYRWQRWQAVRLFAAHPLRSALRERVASLLIATPPASNDIQYPLELLWTAHACGWIEDTLPFDAAASDAPIDPRRLMEHPSPDVRAWTVRLVADDHAVSSSTLSALDSLAQREQDPHVLAQIACSAKRLPAHEALAIMSRLLNRSLPTDDPFLPLLCWWTVEQHATTLDAFRGAFLNSPRMWEQPLAGDVILPNLIRRWSTIGTPEAHAAVADAFRTIANLEKSRRATVASAAQSAFEQAYVGRSLSGVPDTVIDAMVALGQPPLTLQMRRGDASALDEAARQLVDRNANAATRAQIARLAGELPQGRIHPSLLESMLKVLADDSAPSAVRIAAISGLAGFESPRVPESLIGQWPKLPAELRPAAGATLASRPDWTVRWLDAAQAASVAADEMPPEAVRAMRLHSDEALSARVAKRYPEFASIDLATANERSRTLAQLTLEGPGDPYRGKKLYREQCGRCHYLFDEGGRVGPDLTGYQRDQLETLLRNIVAPSLEIREGYQTVRVLTDDGQVLSGFIENEQNDQIVVRNIDGQLHTLQRDSIERLQPQVLSLMPEGLLDKLDATQLRDLMAYLRSSQPLNDGS